MLNTIRTYRTDWMGLKIRRWHHYICNGTPCHAQHYNTVHLNVPTCRTFIPASPPDPITRNRDLVRDPTTFRYKFCDLFLWIHSKIELFPLINRPKECWYCLDRNVNRLRGRPNTGTLKREVLFLFSYASSLKQVTAWLTRYITPVILALLASVFSYCCRETPVVLTDHEPTDRT